MRCQRLIPSMLACAVVAASAAHAHSHTLDLGAPYSRGILFTYDPFITSLHHLPAPEVQQQLLARGYQIPAPGSAATQSAAAHIDTLHRFAPDNATRHEVILPPGKEAHFIILTYRLGLLSSHSIHRYYTINTPS